MSEGDRDPWSGCGLILGLAFLSVAILGFQGFVWLKTGEWLELPLWRTLEMFGLDWMSWVEIEGWAGVSKILDWMVDVPTAVCPLIAAVVVGAVNNVVDEIRTNHSE